MVRNPRRGLRRSSAPPAGAFAGHRPVKDSTPPSCTATPAGPYSDSITAREVIELFARNQSVPAPPPLKVFFGDFKEDKMGLPEFLRMYKHRYGPCSEETKVDMLGEYLAGHAKQVYRSIVSSWDGSSSITFAELESRMRNLMMDNSRTGVLLRQERVHSLRIQEEQSYLSFITVLETKASEAYEDASWSTVDGVKTQVLLKNIRNPTLALQVEHALRTVPEGSPLFPTAKDLVIAYWRTEKQSRQWTRSGENGWTEKNGSDQSTHQYKVELSTQVKSDTGNGGGTPVQPNSRYGSAPPRWVPRCYKCQELGHKMAECPRGDAPRLFEGSAGAARFGTRHEVTCYNCGELGHKSLDCPRRGHGNFTRTSDAAQGESAQSGSASAVVRKPEVTEMDVWLNMGMSQVDVAGSRKVEDWLSELTKEPALREICKLPDGARTSALSNMGLALESNRLYKVFPDGRKVLVVPASCRKNVFDKVHASVGHVGWRATVTAVLRDYYWHGVRNDIAKWLNACKECSRHKLRASAVGNGQRCQRDVSVKPCCVHMRGTSGTSGVQKC